MTKLHTLRANVLLLRRDRSGLALIEFALVLPVLLTMSLTGAELTNYITMRMRVSQVALHVADNAARMGTGTLLAPKSVSETDINDVLTGAGLQSGSLDIYGRGRIIMSSLQPVADPNIASRYKIVWQRCRGDKAAHASTYGKAGDTNLTGIGPAGRQVTAQDYNATMFVEVYYEYKPLIAARIAPSTTIVETASMAVRDRRDLSDDSADPKPTHPKGIYNLEKAPVSNC